MAIKGDFISVMTLGIFREETTVVSPAVGDVEEGVQYGDGGNEFIGTFGVPAEAEVKEGIGYGEDGSEFTGTLTVDLNFDPNGTDQDLSHSPAYIVSRFLIAQSHLIEPNASGDWPVFVGAIPDSKEAPHDAVSATDTTPLKDGRWMGGSPLFHPGFQLMVRASAYQDGWTKAAALAKALSGITETAVSVEESTYVMHAITQTTGVTAIGQEQGSKRRFLFTVNFLATIREV